MIGVIRHDENSMQYCSQGTEAIAISYLIPTFTLYGLCIPAHAAFHKISNAMRDKTAIAYHKVFKRFADIIDWKFSKDC